MNKVVCILMMLISIIAVPVAPAFAESNSFIKWVDCNVTDTVLKKVYDLDVKYHGTDTEFDFVEVLSYLTTKNGNKFSSSDMKNLYALCERLEKKETTVREIYGDNKYYKYYLEAYGAIFGEFIGEYRVEGDENAHYGLKAYFPFAKGFWHNHYDDFANRRDYGFKRLHLGHDIMGSVGTPIVAIEGGTVTEYGWNRYGGWRVGIRSFDTKRYYYYAHLRKDKPYAQGIEKGSVVNAGEVIGFLGTTGYSYKENVNMPKVKPHLHLGLQLIFDESQVDGNGEIWIDMYAVTKFLYNNRAAVEKDPESKEYKSVKLRKAV